MTLELEQAELNEQPEALATPETPVETQETAETLYTPKQVSAIVARERNKALEKGRKEAMMEVQNQQGAEAPQQQAMQQAPQQQASLGGMPQMSQEDMMRIMAEKMPEIMQQQIQSAKQEQMINGFVNKMKAAEEQHPGLEAELNQINWRDPRTSALAVMANDLENTGDVMKELLDHPSKFGDLLNLVESQPHLAAKSMYSLSNSIKQNKQAAAENKQAKEPMSQMKPSVNTGLDNSAATVTDFRKMQW